MTAYLLADHLLNFMAPAAFLALAVLLLARVFARFFGLKRSVVPVLWAQAAIVFVANMLVLTAGLLLFGNDGKMATYAALVLASALCLWLMWRGWTA